MTTDAWQTGTNGNGNGPDARATPTDQPDATQTAADHAREIYEHLLALSNQVGAVYMEAYEKAAAGIGDLQRQAAAAGLPNLFEPGAGWQAGSPFGDIPEPLHQAAERALEMSEKLSERSRKVTLAYLDACEAAALAVADWQEEAASSSPLELFQSLGTMQAELTREATKACASTARELLG
jgi:hypothetical protein